MMKDKWRTGSSRRTVLKQCGLGCAGLVATPASRAGQGEGLKPRLRIGVIGIAGQGLWNIEQLLKADATIVALCDVDERRADGARSLCPRARFFTDFRIMLDKAGRDIDAVLVATPDHTHALATITALQAGKHVYCEKPLAHSVWEARQVMAAAKKHKRVTQMGIQIHAGRNYRRVVELIRSGAIGTIREVHAWCPTVWSGGEHPTESPAPKGLNWDLWLGPAPERPYADKAYVPAAWRGWWDFGGGGCADMGCHFLDLAYWALELRHPATIQAEGPPVDSESAPPWLVVRYEYPARGERPPVRVTWTVGIDGPQSEGKKAAPDWKEGVLFVGDEGKLVADFNHLKLLPVEKFIGFKPPSKSIPASIGHHQEFIKACMEGGTTSCSFDYAEAVLLGNVAYRAGHKIEWDPVHMTIPNAPEAEKFLRRPEYREGWELPSP